MQHRMMLAKAACCLLLGALALAASAEEGRTVEFEAEADQVLLEPAPPESEAEPITSAEAPNRTEGTDDPDPSDDSTETVGAEEQVPMETTSLNPIDAGQDDSEASGALLEGFLDAEGYAGELLFISEFDPEFIGPPAGAKPQRAVLSLLGEEVHPGERRSLTWKVSESFSGEALSTPVLVVHGANPGPRLCITAAVHGDELNGVEIVRRVMSGLDEKRLAGAVIGVPIVNLFGFSRGSRYLPDRRDLNRFFPGSPTGSVASRIAHSLFNGVITACDALVDIHTGSFDRSNLPQIRGDLTQSSVLELTRSFGATAVLHTPGDRGMLRRAATDRQIPAVTFEVGSPLRLEPEEIAQGVTAIQTLMQRMGMTPRRRNVRNEPQPIYYESRWIRATGGGMLFSDVKLGDRVRPGQRLGNIIDPLRDNQRDIVSPVRGRVIGMAQNQVVLPGFAAYHIGVEASEEQVVEEAQLQRNLEIDGPPPEHDRMDSEFDDSGDEPDDHYGPPESDDEGAPDPPPENDGPQLPQEVLSGE